MPVKKAGDTPPSNNRDIREFVTPPRLKRNRRIVESDSSDDQAPEPQNEPQQTPPVANNDGAPEPQNEPQQTPPVVHNDGDQIPQLIQIDDSDDDSSDSMYVAVIRPRDGAHNQNENAIPPQHQSQPRNVRMRNAMQNASQSQRQGRQTSQNQGPIAPVLRQQPQPNPCRHTRHTNETPCIGEAESTSESESSALSADESSENAADLYRSAILGVRNRPNAVRQVS
jgi:hypothetical protein